MERQSVRPAYRVILHVDMDAFFAQAEVLADPRLQGKPLVVGGFPGQRGVVATASYEARPYGIHSGMPLAEAARLCPHAVFLPCHSARYFDLSARILKLLLARTPLVEMASIDEAFLDASDLVADLREGDGLAVSIQGDLGRSLRLSCSVGTAPNKLIAKMASALDKPGGRTVLGCGAFRSRFAGEPVSMLYGIGPATAALLSRAGIDRIGQLAGVPEGRLARLLGKWGPVLGAAARGEDESPVIAYHSTREAKSLGHEYTLPVDVEDRSEIRRLLLALSDEVACDLRREGRVGDTVHLKVRWNDFRTIFRQCRFSAPLRTSKALFQTAWALFLRSDTGQRVRMLGISVSGLVAQAITPRAGDLFGSDRSDDLDCAADAIRRLFGHGAIRRASLLTKGAP